MSTSTPPPHPPNNPHGGFHHPGAPSQRKRPWYKRPGCLIPLLLVLGLLFFGSCVAALAGAGDIDNATPAPAPGATQPPGQQESPEQTAEETGAPAKVGDTVKAGNFQFVVSKPKCGVAAVGPQGFEQKAQGQYCIVPMTVENTGTEPEMFGDDKVTGYIGGSEYKADTMATMYADQEANGQSSSFLQNVNPGNSVKGSIVFDLPKDKSLDAVELKENIFSQGTRVSLK